MKKNMQNIDHLYYESLESFEVQPSSELFDEAYGKFKGTGKVGTSPTSLASLSLAIVGSISVFLYLSFGQANNNKTLTAKTLADNSTPVRQVTITKPELNKSAAASVNIKNKTIILDNSFYDSRQQSQPDKKSFSQLKKKIGNNSDRHSNDIINPDNQMQISPTVLASKNKIANDLENLNKELAIQKIESYKSKSIEKSSFTSSNLSSEAYALGTMHKIQPLVLKSKTPPDSLNYLVRFNTLKVLNKGWSIEIAGSSVVVASSLKALNQESQSFVDTRNNSLESVFNSYSISMLIGRHWRSLCLQTGLMYSSFNEQTNYGLLPINPENIWTLQPNGNPYTFEQNGQFFLVDTTGGYWHYTYVLDSMLHVNDSAWVYLTDTLPVKIYDSLLTNQFTDTLDLSRLHIRYKLFELPIWIGYENAIGRWGYSLNAGILPGLLVRTSGQWFNGEEIIALPGDIFPKNKFTLSAGLRFSVSYFLTSQWTISAGPTYRHSLIPLKGTSGDWQQNLYSWGFSLRLKYFFK